MNRIEKIGLVVAPELESSDRAAELKSKFGTSICDGSAYLKYTENGLSLCDAGNEIRADFTRLVARIKNGNLQKELLVRASRIKKDSGILTAVDATAGFGEDSFFLAAAGFNVIMFERNPIISELLSDALERAGRVSGLDTIASRMRLIEDDSVDGMGRLIQELDVVLLDPMFPQRQKSSLVKKKLQMIQRLEAPCENEAELFSAAVKTGAKKLIVKRPPKGGYLAGIKPDYSIAGKAVRFDCYVNNCKYFQKAIENKTNS